MRAQWELKAVRAGLQRSAIRRRNGCRRFRASHEEALSLARSAAEHLRQRGVIRVEAWTCAVVSGDQPTPNGPPLVFRIRPHQNKRDWLAEANELHHGGWFLRLQSALDYAMFRASGQICAIHVLNGAGAVERVILADNTHYDSTPIIAPELGSPPKP